MPNNNPSIPSDVSPAQVVGGMRVKQPNHHNHLHNKKTEEEEKEQESLEDEQMRARILQERQAQDMKNHSASRQHDIPKNPGNFSKQINNPAIQPRAMNH
ncbi:hypothetical protein A0J61_02576 [Choanephora cucurbitarum]|uniref:Uncharacterized protein n=1 Tax=Choanephora cucurbitarum TaxID=101091 RepID=A0A1C7NKP2_9FUNG|nr:hypothetical protein A0J61_02576 [Choanephora cucurbitarum]